MPNMSFLKFQFSFPEKSTSPLKKPAQAHKSKQTWSWSSSITGSFSSSSGSGRWSMEAKSEELKWVFDKFDSNKDGKISIEEYKAALRTMNKGSSASNSEAVKAFQVMDSDGDGFIDLKEFTEMFNGGGRVKESELKSAFQVFDLDGDGKISAQELCQVLKRLGERTTLTACQQMVKGVDGDGDGFIDFNEFSKMMINGKKLA